MAAVMLAPVLTLASFMVRPQGLNAPLGDPASWCTIAARKQQRLGDQLVFMAAAESGYGSSEDEAQLFYAQDRRGAYDALRPEDTLTVDPGSGSHVAAFSGGPYSGGEASPKPIPSGFKQKRPPPSTATEPPPPDAYPLFGLPDELRDPLFGQQPVGPQERRGARDAFRPGTRLLAVSPDGHHVAAFSPRSTCGPEVLTPKLPARLESGRSDEPEPVQSTGYESSSRERAFSFVAAAGQPAATAAAVAPNPPVTSAPPPTVTPVSSSPVTVTAAVEGIEAIQAEVAAAVERSQTALPQWSVEHVCSFVGELELPASVVGAFRQNAIDGDLLLGLSDDEMVEELGMRKLMVRKLRREMSKLEALREEAERKEEAAMRERAGAPADQANPTGGTEAGAEAGAKAGAEAGAP